ncbi:36.4 kDa proline-rich protein-like [Helianthus annuus]|uniref:36.4 kDa proline-rich protein-like n=1 Tax=Helianthus annuus TaxID=4232 RepID=UPI000B90389E|nr:36.4 kDa proline-rich protein-like [Helianthus annuus]
MAMSTAPIVPHDFDPDPEVEFVPAGPPLADPEPDIAPEPVLAHDPMDVPAIALLPDPLPEPDHVDIPVVAPPVVDAPVVAPPVTDVPVVVAPLPDPAPVFVDRAPFSTHVDPRYADTRNGWIEDDDYPPFVLPVTPPAAPDIPPPRPGEGPSTQQHKHMPLTTATFPFMPPFAPTAHAAFPSSAPSGEPFMWSSPNVMPLSDPYHPFHVGYTTDDILISLQLQQDMLSRRVAELERISHPPSFADPPQTVFPPAPSFPYPDYHTRFLTMEQQIACLMRFMHALEEDLVYLRRLLFFPPPLPPPSA